MHSYRSTIMAFLASSYFWYYASTYTDWHFIDNVNLIFHEAGHTIFFFVGEFVQVCMGSGFQILIPILISLYFYIQGQKLSAALCVLWVGQNFLNVSVYAGDAQMMNLPLLGGEGAMHDWNYILTEMNSLNYTSSVAYGLYVCGIALVSIGTVTSLYCALMKDKAVS